MLFNKLFTIKGRSSRKEYIIKFLITLFLGITRSYTKKYTDNEIIYFFYILFLGGVSMMMLLQYFPLAIRRLHDLNASGWYALITFAAFGQMLILWCMFKKGTTGTNLYGEPPEY